jgi:pentatricopeptide repeat protein
LDTGNSLLSLELQHQHDSEHQQRQEEDVDDTDELTSSLDRLRASVAECRAETSWTQFQHLQESNRTDELSTDTLLDMLYVVGKYGHEGSVRLHRIDLLSSTIRSRSITQREYNRLVGGLACIGSYQLGLDVVREMKSLGMFVFDETYAALVRHMVSHRQVDMALKLFRSLSSSSSSSSATTSPTDQERADVVASRTSVILSAFLQGFSRISDYDSVISFAQLKQKSGTLTKRDYLWILNVCLHYEMVEEADKWMDQMINEGFNLDLVSVRRALYCYAKGNAINRTKYWFRRFQEMDFGTQL